MEAAEAAKTSDSPSTTEGAARSGIKRAREPLQLFGSPLIKDEDQESEAASEGAGAVVPSESPSPAAAESVRVGKAMLRCSLCSHTLKKPIYQCAVGHLACCGCRVKLPDNGCRKCRARGAAVAFAHSPGLDIFFSKVQVPCPYEQYGCGSFVPYFKAADHRAACAHAPCFCPEPGCGLVYAPRTLLPHVARDHAWPAAGEVPYGTPLLLAVPVPEEAAAAAAAPAAAARGRRAAGLEGGYFFATVPVRSTALADGDGAAPEKGLFFAVPREMLRKGEVSSRELVLSVRIDRSFGPETCGTRRSLIIQQFSLQHYGLVLLNSHTVETRNDIYDQARFGIPVAVAQANLVNFVL
ncbi:hypothetical protein EJB05_31831 [Eragrostis curvula]|uniref:SIAH-type domain-containing protein n=1 Tax=Eragrostis curvula TaxID=38414 RepID=A0A5J9UEI1_9POAL|nr:hypothetical protein EJB05_31831 [Eragrostis curvula]